MQLFGKLILNIFSEERGEDILPLLPMEKLSKFAFRPKLSNMSHLTEEQRYTIVRMLQAGYAKKDICIAIVGYIR